MKRYQFIAIISSFFVVSCFYYIVFFKYSFDYIIVLDLKKDNSGKCKIGLKLNGDIKKIIQNIDKDYLCNSAINKIFERHQMRINKFDNANVIYNFDNEKNLYEITFNFQNINKLNKILQTVFANDNKNPSIKCIHKNTNKYSFLFALPSLSTKLINERELINNAAVRSFDLKFFSSKKIRYIFKCHFYETINKISDNTIFVNKTKDTIHVILPFYDENLINKVICKTVELKSIV